MSWEQAQEKIRELEEEVRFWRKAYNKAIRHDDRVIRQVRREAHYEHG